MSADKLGAWLATAFARHNIAATAQAMAAANADADDDADAAGADAVAGTVREGVEPVAAKYAADWPAWGHRKIYA